MLTVDDYGKIRRAFRDGMSIHELARTFHHSRAKIREILANAQPRPYTRSTSPPAPILGCFHAVIDAILAADEDAPRKQRHTAMQVFRRLRDEHGFRGGYDAVRRYIGKQRRDHRETFIPLAHDPGQRLECDFGHIHVDFPDGRRLVPVLIAAWAYSHYGFALALPTERTEAILTGLVEAFTFFDCVPHEVWWDNPTTVVAQIFTGRDRRPNAYYAALASHYTFEPLFCMPARGNEKPHAETRVRVLQQQWATPVPQVADLKALNLHLRQRCVRELERRVDGYQETIGQRFDMFADNTAYGIGGGLWNGDQSTVRVSNSTFTGNKAIGSLAFVYPDEGYALGSGGTEGGGMDNDGTATVSGCTFTGNTAQGITGSNGAGSGAKGGAIATDGDLTITGSSTFTGNKAIGGDGGAGAPGHDGGSGGQSAGGAVNIDGAATNATIESNTSFQNNEALGGNGGAGSNGHNGGAGGVGTGGALSLADATLTLTDSTFTDNQAVGGIGGAGGKNGDGGVGGIGRGGAFVHTVTTFPSTPVSNLDNVVMQDNQAIGGAGGVGGVNGNGGTGGTGQGGGIRALLGTIIINNSHLDENQATGGLGGAAGAGGKHGGNGGDGQGGGLFTTFGVTATLSNTDLLDNLALGGAGAAGGIGGNGLGGGLFNDGPSPFGTPSLTLLGCKILFNEADGGAAGEGGSDGQGIGGGVYNLGTFLYDLATVIARNNASTSNDNIFTT